MVIEIEKFYGCYCLVSANPKYKGRTYIGFTVDPNRRVNQHNIGKHKGGAWRTSGKGPWDMVIIIHGFPNMVSALQFEWAWQHPSTSHKLKHIKAPPGCKHGFKFRFYVVSEMLRTGPWNRLPLTIRWLNQDFAREFECNLQPPTHMPITYGPVKSSKPKFNPIAEERSEETCLLCHKTIQVSMPKEMMRYMCASAGLVMAQDANGGSQQQSAGVKRSLLLRQKHPQLSLSPM